MHKATAFATFYLYIIFMCLAAAPAWSSTVLWRNRAPGEPSRRHVTVPLSSPRYVTSRPCIIYPHTSCHIPQRTCSAFHTSYTGCVACRSIGRRSSAVVDGMLGLQSRYMAVGSKIPVALPTYCAEAASRPGRGELRVPMHATT